MYTPTPTQLDAHLDRVIHRIQEVRTLSFSTEESCQRALEEIRDVQGALAVYRQLLRRSEMTGAFQPRLAA